MQLREQNPEVFYASDRIVTVGEEEIRFLKERAAQNPRLRSRLCTHPDPSASVHEMLIVHHQSVYVRPHHHIAKSESFHIVEGAASVVLMDQTGGIVSVIPVGDPKTGRSFYYRMPDTLMHTFIIESEWLVFHETTGGPFDPQKTVFAEWSPDGTNDKQAQHYLADLSSRARAFLETRSPIQ